MENIRYGNLAATEEEIIEAAKNRSSPRVYQGVERWLPHSC